MWAHIRWRGQVASATRGKRGQQLIKDAIEALDALPEKKLIARDLECNGQYCTLGAVGAKRGIDLKPLDPEDYEAVAATFDVASPLAREIVFMNDEWGNYDETPEGRWFRMRNWLASQLVEKKSTSAITS
jgi:hypothetical protein